MKQIPESKKETISDKKVIFTDIVSLHHKKRSQAILNSGKNPEELINIGLQDGQIPVVKAALENINNPQLIANIANTFSSEIISLFKKLLKGQTGRSYQQSGGFFWHIDIGGIVLFREKFGKYIDFDLYIKQRVFDLIKDIDQNKLANKIINTLVDIDFSEEIKKGLIFHLNIQTPLHIDMAIIFNKIYGNKIDLVQTIINNRKSIESQLEKAGKNIDIDRITTINDCFGNIVDLGVKLKEVFLNYLKTSYQNSYKISNLLIGMNYEKEIKEGFLDRLKKKDLIFAKRIRNDFGKGIDFSNEIHKGIDYLKMKGYIEDALKTQKELL